MMALEQAREYLEQLGLTEAAAALEAGPGGPAEALLPRGAGGPVGH